MPGGTSKHQSKINYNISNKIVQNISIGRSMEWTFVLNETQISFISFTITLERRCNQIIKNLINFPNKQAHLITSLSNSSRIEIKSYGLKSEVVKKQNLPHDKTLRPRERQPMASHQATTCNNGILSPVFLFLFFFRQDIKFIAKNVETYN